MRTSTMAGLALMVFMGALGVVVGQRMSGDTLAVLAGVVAGIAASIPTSLIVVWLVLRNAKKDRHAEDEGRLRREGRYRRESDEEIYGRTRYVALPTHTQPMPRLQYPAQPPAPGYGGYPQGYPNGYGYGAGAPDFSQVGYGPYLTGSQPPAPPDRDYTVIGGDMLDD